MEVLVNSMYRRNATQYFFNWLLIGLRRRTRFCCLESNTILFFGQWGGVDKVVSSYTFSLIYYYKLLFNYVSGAESKIILF